MQLEDDKIDSKGQTGQRLPHCHSLNSTSDLYKTKNFNRELCSASPDRHSPVRLLKDHFKSLLEDCGPSQNDLRQLCQYTYQVSPLTSTQLLALKDACPELHEIYILMDLFAIFCQQVLDPERDLKTKLAEITF